MIEIVKLLDAYGAWGVSVVLMYACRYLYIEKKRISDAYGELLEKRHVELIRLARDQGLLVGSCERLLDRVQTAIERCEAKGKRD